MRKKYIWGKSGERLCEVRMWKTSIILDREGVGVWSLIDLHGKLNNKVYLKLCHKQTSCIHRLNWKNNREGVPKKEISRCFNVCSQSMCNVFCVSWCGYNYCNKTIFQIWGKYYSFFMYVKLFYAVNYGIQ